MRLKVIKAFFFFFLPSAFVFTGVGVNGVLGGKTTL